MKTRAKTILAAISALLILGLGGCICFPDGDHHGGGGGHHGGGHGGGGHYGGHH